MGIFRKTLRVATLPLGPAGVKGSSKKQRVAKATLRAEQAQARALSPTGDPLRDQRLRLAEAQLNLAKAQLSFAVQRAKANKIAESEVKVAAAELKLEELRSSFGLL